MVSKCVKRAACGGILKFRSMRGVFVIFVKCVRKGGNNFTSLLVKRK